MITYTPCFKKKTKLDNKGIINIRITENRISKYISLKLSISESDWDKNRCAVKNKPKNKDLDPEQINNKIKETIDELKRNSQKEIQEINTKIFNEKKSFLTFFENQINHLLERKQIGTHKSYKSSKKHFTNFLSKKGKSDIEFLDIDTLIVRDFETYLLAENVSQNSSKKYISILKKVYNVAKEYNFFETSKDPFIVFKNNRLAFQKEFLSKIEVEQILNTVILKKDSLYDVKNYFVFQIFAQGLRVSDLITLRWGNINGESIEFSQMKTKSFHNIHLNFILITILKDYLPDSFNRFFEAKNKISIEGKIYDLNYHELKEKSKEVNKKHISKFIKNIPESVKIVEELNKDLDLIRHIIKIAFLTELKQYISKHKNEFIFPILKNEDFKEMSFEPKNNLSKFQHNQMSAKTAFYNKQLKKLQKLCEIDKTITSHMARHTYTNLMIESTEKDVYSISKSLGHNSLLTTDHYVNSLLTVRHESANEGLVREFN